jgi:protein MPE1
VPQEFRLKDRMAGPTCLTDLYLRDISVIVANKKVCRYTLAENATDISGHWIYDCPTNDDPNFVPKPKLKKTTGIPRSLLERVEKAEDDEEEDPSKPSSRYMLDADGNRVRVRTDNTTWEKEQARQKASAAKSEAAAEANKDLQERGLECSIDHRLFDVPTKTPCCSKTYCYSCIEDALVNNDLICINCGTENVLLDDLLPDNDMAVKIKAYRDEKKSEAEAKDAAEEAKLKAEAEAQLAEAKRLEAEKAAKEAADEKQASVEKSNTPQETANATSPGSDAGSARARSQVSKLRSPSPSRSVVSARSTQMARTKSTESNSKKRPAEDDLKEDVIPKAPAAMLKQQEQARITQESALPQFIQDMEKLSKGDLPTFMAQANQMGQMPNMQGMPDAMAMMNMNPMMMNNMMNMPNMGMNMPNPAMNGNNMNYQQQQNNGYNNGNQHGNWQQNRGGYNNWNNNRGGYQNNFRQYNNYNNNNNNNNQNFNQPQTQNGYNNFQNQRGGFRQPVVNQPGFNKDHPNEEDDPYFRQPVNPHRHQQRKRMRPSEYTELGGP